MPNDDVLVVWGSRGNFESQVRAFTTTRGGARANLSSFLELVTPGLSAGLPAGERVEILIFRRGLGQGFWCCCSLEHLEDDGFWYDFDDLDQDDDRIEVHVDYRLVRTTALSSE